MTAAHRPLTLALRVLFFALVAATMVLALTPVKTAGGAGADKWHHFAAFYALALLGLAAYPRASVLLVAAALCLFGGAIEIVQGIPAIGRSRELLDWIADIVGILLAAAPLALARWRVSASGKAAA